MEDYKPRSNGLDEEIDEIKKNKTKVWFNYDTGTPGVIFVKILDCFKELIDIHALSQYIMNQIQTVVK